MTTCAFHPDRKAPLFCRECERPVCSECVRNSSVGTKCLVCNGENPPEQYTDELLAKVEVIPDRPLNRAQKRRFQIVFLISALLSLIVSPIGMSFGAIGFMAYLGIKQIPGRLRLLVSLAITWVSWILFVPTAVKAGSGSTYLMAATLLVVSAFIMVPAALRVGEQFLRANRSTVAGVISGFFCGLGVSNVLMAVLMIIASFPA